MGTVLYFSDLHGPPVMNLCSYRSQKWKKTPMTRLSFGALSAKAGHKYVGEIDPPNGKIDNCFDLTLKKSRRRGQ